VSGVGDGLAGSQTGTPNENKKGDRIEFHFG